MIALGCLLLGVVTRADDAADRHFTERVKPLLDLRCVSCHGTEKQKGALRLDSRPAVLKGGDNGPAVVPGRPSESLLLQAVMHSKKDLEMPPKEKLTPADIAVLKRWIEDGAPWPEVEAIATTATPLKAGERIRDAWSDPRNPIVKIFGGQRLELWSVKPVQRVRPPVVANKRWVRNSIDQFVLARLEKAGLTPSVEADRRALARRLYFDLTGLPPTPEETAAFVRDPSPQAYEHLVDRLLASSRYGEHCGRQWLDVVRYSDSNGFDWDEFRPRAWRFRDYIIRSFNADKPFDQFIREQLAGDELIEGAPKTEVEQDSLIATGYLRMGPQDNSAAAFNEQARARAELMSDLVETTSSAFLGLTMSCCRCHDHKYDPLSQADHYRMRAFFEAVKYADDTPLDLAAVQESIRRHNQSVDGQLQPVQEKREALLSEIRKKLREEKVNRLTPEERDLLNTAKEKQTAELKAKIEALEKKLEPNDKETQAALNPEQKQTSDLLVKEIEELKKRKRSFTLGLLATDNADKVPVTKILFQGDHKTEREPVEPGFISILDPNPASIAKGANSKTTGRRLTLANWITSPGNPLTARVLVNRVWQSHFGKGLVGTPNDFGLAGARPSNPELLDWLASEFVRQGWSLKKLHRLIVTSATYRQASRNDDLRFTLYESKLDSESLQPAANRRLKAGSSDPDNVFLGRQNLRRLSAEQLRDSLFHVSGLLNERNGGPPAWPDLPPDVLQANPAFLDDNETKTKGWYPSAKAEQTVRSVYLVQKRTVRVPFMETFDLPENSTSCARRTESTVAPQALTLLNGADAVNAARALAHRVETEAGATQEERIRRAFALALQRSPTEDEQRVCIALLRERSLTELCRALLNLNEFIYID
jgi:hypothetical protein